MKITATMLYEIAAMPEQAMAASLRFLAAQLEADERKRGLAAARQQRYRDTHGDVSVASEQRHNNAIVTFARVKDKPLPFLKVEPSQQDTPHNPPSEPPETSHETFEALTGGWTRFWNVYPNRAGGRDKQNAFKAFRAASKRAPIETIIAGAERYAAHCNSTGKAGTEFIRQARTWLNANGWEEDYGGSKQPAQTIAVKPVFKDTPEWEELKAAKGGRLAALPLRDPDTKQYLGEGAWKQSA